MPAAFELARDELVSAVKDNIGMLMQLKERNTSKLDQRALSAIIDAFKRYEAAWAQNQHRQTDVR
jgi:hypothetical protein